MEGNMFCYQCQEAAKGVGCVLKGVCGKNASTPLRECTPPIFTACRLLSRLGACPTEVSVVQATEWS